MNKGIGIFLGILAFSVLFPSRGTSQLITEDWLKSEYTILLSSYMSWPGEEKIDTFRVGVLANEAVYTQLSLKSELQTLKGKPFRTLLFRNLSKLQPVEVLFVDEQKNNLLKRIYKRMEDQAFVMVTDSAKNWEYIMVNLLGMNLAGKKPFELNKANIERTGLEVSPKILFVGGSEDDLRDIYRELEDEGARMRAELDTLSRSLAVKQAELIASEEKLAARSAEIEKLIHEIEYQTEQLSTLSDSVNLKQLDLVDKIRLLGRQEDRIREREAEISELNRDIQAKEQEILERSKVIEKQLDDIVLQTAMMKEQQKILDSQKIQIERQKMVLGFFLILSVLILGLGFVSYRAYRIKKRANRILQEKNRVIAEQNQNILNQKEEIQAQRDELQEVNRKIEKQNENITASIYYALTIQQAMLPDLAEMKKHYEGFVIYLPKDIVSGDFYWFSRRENRRAGERYHYLAVVDCTGHGVPGGFLSMIGARMLYAIVNEQRNEDTHTILELMDKRIRKALNQHKSDNDDGMDVCLCKITEKTGDKEHVYLSFSGARRPLFLLRKGKELEMIRGDRRTIGGKYFNPNPFSRTELSLRRGDCIYLTSDGLMDQHSPKREKFGTRRFINILNENRVLGMNEQRNIIEEALMGFMKMEKQRDDITIMGINL